MGFRRKFYNAKNVNKILLQIKYKLDNLILVTYNNKPFNERAYILYVNGGYKGNDDIGKLVHDFQCEKP